MNDLEDEIARLINIAQQAHDRLLRGDSDKELLALLEKAWKERRGATGAARRWMDCTAMAAHTELVKFVGCARIVAIVSANDSVPLGDGLGEPQADIESGQCKKECPYRKEWRHPYWNHTAWCWHMMKDLGWYDYWLADCLTGEPDQYLASHKNSGRTLPPTNGTE